MWAEGSCFFILLSSDAVGYSTFDPPRFIPCKLSSVALFRSSSSLSSWASCAGRGGDVLHSTLLFHLGHVRWVSACPLVDYHDIIGKRKRRHASEKLSIFVRKYCNLTQIFSWRYKHLTLYGWIGGFKKKKKKIIIWLKIRFLFGSYLSAYF